MPNAIFIKSRKGATALTYGLVVGLVGVGALQAVTSLGDSITDLFRDTASSIDGNIVNRDEPADIAPNSLIFPALSDQQISQTVVSDIIQVTDHDGVDVILTSSEGSPEVRVCADGGCSEVISGFGSNAQPVANGEFIQIRVTTSSSPTTEVVVEGAAGSTAFTWSVSTGAESFAFTSHTFSTCGVTGRTGPSLSQCRSAYSTSWDENSSFFSVSSGIQRWTVPATGSYRIEVLGARGGGNSDSNLYGARMRGDFSLTQGTELKILVGHQGTCSSGWCGGGGGSFVTRADNTPLIIAGGGGGQDTRYSTSSRQQGTTSGTGQTAGPNCSSINSGGSSGNGGAGGGGGGGGGGLNGNGGDSPGGQAFVSGGAGGSATYGEGGFGGGGGTNDDQGGGGGGYSGGGGCGENGNGGGGGSYNGGSNPSNNSGYNSGHGSVTITRL